MRKKFRITRKRKKNRIKYTKTILAKLQGFNIFFFTVFSYNVYSNINIF